MLKVRILAAICLVSGSIFGSANAEPATKSVDLKDASAAAEDWKFVVTTTDRTLPADPDTDWDEDKTESCYAMWKGGTPDPEITCTFSTAATAIPEWEGAPATVGFQRHFGRAEVVYAASGAPFFLVATYSEPSVNGSRARSTILFAYDRSSASFHAAFAAVVGTNNNQEIRFVQNGPLTGDVIVIQPGVFRHGSRPYGYDVSVFRPSDCCSYSQVLRYRSMTSYGDGNKLAVIDAEMAEILRQLGHWKAGMPLPQPERRPDGCDTLKLVRGVEWCASATP